LKQLPFFSSIREIVADSLIAAILIETDVDTLCAYLEYLQKHSEKAVLLRTALVRPANYFHVLIIVPFLFSLLSFLYYMI
jgi:hypothetical protein